MYGKGDMLCNNHYKKTFDEFGFQLEKLKGLIS